MNATTTSTHHGYPVFSLFFSFAASAMLGFIIGFAYLLSIPPKPISTETAQNESAEEPFSLSELMVFNNRVTYYRSSNFRQNAQALTKKLYASTTNQIEISAMELNAWAAASLAPKPNLSSQNDGEKSSFVSFHPKIPVFQIAEKQLHIAYPAEVEAWSQKWNLILIASGVFKQGDSSPDWDVKKLTINSAPVPFKKIVYRFAKPKILEAVAENENATNLQTAWKMIITITVGDATLSVVRK